MFRLPGLGTFLLGHRTLFVGALLTDDGDFIDAIAGKPCSYRYCVYLEVNYWLQDAPQQCKVYYPVSFVFDYRTKWSLAN
ncbi:hypothetical protein [Pseudomonas sp. NPDC089569]|uniref:hypothetical protein n=1 Tax=Pseudomonas sp. NPDC089569 TaxID=3390722 RepID=UPI003D026787